MPTVAVSPAFTATFVVADLKPWSSAVRAHTPVATSANLNSPRSFETSILGSPPPHVSVSVTPGTTNGWPSGAGTDTAPAIADVTDWAAADPPGVDATNSAAARATLRYVPEMRPRVRVTGRLVRPARRRPWHRR